MVEQGIRVMPSVAAVVVTHEPGDWFTSTLEALAAQDYPDLRVVVVDSGSPVDPSARVHQILPGAAVHRLRKNVGFGAAANEILDGGLAEADAAGAEFLLFCHDDVAPEPTATRVLVETAREWHANVVGPKLVGWDDPRWVLQMGEAVDKTATAVPLIESGELDQGQHDGLREVFAVPGGVTLVRAKTFARIGGFDETIKFVGDNLSLCWRTRIAGGRVLVTSATRVRHRQALDDRIGNSRQLRLAARARLRVLLTCYGPLHLFRVLPQVAVMSLLATVVALATTRSSDARASVGAWWWNLWRLRSTLIARGQVRRFRRVADAALRRLQVPGLTRSQRVVRRHHAVTPASVSIAGNGADGVRLGNGDAVPAEGDTPPTPRPTAQPLGRQAPSSRGWTSGSVVLSLALAALLVMGSRHLLTRGVPLVGQLVPFDGPSNLFDEWLSGWRRTGLGSDDPAPSILAALSALGALVDGHMALLRTALTVGLIPVGVLGAFRMLRPSGSRRAPVGAAVAYAVVPVPYAALSTGRWAPLAAYAAAPWLLSRLARGSGSPPYAPETSTQRFAAHRETHSDAPERPNGSQGPRHASKDDQRIGWSGVARHALVLGMLTAFLGMVVPAAPVVVSVLAGALALGSLLAFEARYIGRLVAVAVGGVLVAALLHLPWSLAAIAWGRAGDRPPTWFSHPWTGAEATPTDLLGLSTVGPVDGPYAWALLGAAGLALLVGRGWRVGWAIRGWVVALVAWSVVWAHQNGVLEAPLPELDLLMALVGAGLALAIGCGVAAVEVDVAGRGRRLGLRRIAVGLAALAMGVAVVPLARASLDGYWGMPQGDFGSLLATVDEDLADISSRVLWLGHPDVLPVHGWPVEPVEQTERDGNVAFATTLRGKPFVQDLWPGPADEPMQQLADAVNLARTQQTTRLGSLLAPAAVQYIAVPQRLAPAPFGGTLGGASQPAPQDLLDGLAEQLDLQRVQVDPAFVLYRNLAFLPARATVTVPGIGEASDSEGGPDGPSEEPRQTVAEDLALAAPTQAQPALGDSVGFAHDAGELPGDVAVLHSVAGSDNWALLVDGVPVERSTAFGWANQFVVASPGSAELRYETPGDRHLLLLIQAAMWLVASLAVLVMHRRAAARRPEGGVEAMVARPVRQWIDVPTDELVRVITSSMSSDAPAASQGNGGSGTTGDTNDDGGSDEDGSDGGSNGGDEDARPRSGVGTGTAP